MSDKITEEQKIQYEQRILRAMYEIYKETKTDDDTCYKQNVSIAIRSIKAGYLEEHKIRKELDAIDEEIYYFPSINSAFCTCVAIKILDAGDNIELFRLNCVAGGHVESAITVFNFFESVKKLVRVECDWNDGDFVDTLYSDEMEKAVSMLALVEDSDERDGDGENK